MRWTTVVALGALTCAVAWAEEGKKGGFHLDKNDVGKVPTGWKAEKTGKGEGSVWKVVADETTPSKTGLALAQTAESPGSMFNLCVADEPNRADVEVRVSFKAVKTWCRPIEPVKTIRKPGCDCLNARSTSSSSIAVSSPARRRMFSSIHGISSQKKTRRFGLC